MTRRSAPRPPSRTEVKRHLHAMATAAGLSDDKREALTGERAAPAPRSLRDRRGMRLKQSVKREADVQREIMAALKRHPLVHDVVRYNSGAYGERAQYQFNSAQGHSDIAGTRKDSAGFFQEIKRDQRAICTFDQLKFLIGKWSVALCGVSRSIEDSYMIVEGRYTRAHLISEIGRLSIESDRRYLLGLFAQTKDFRTPRPRVGDNEDL